LKIVLASKNSGKIEEFNFLLRKTNIELIPISKFTQEDIDETGSSYEENAFIKAEVASRLSGLPAIGDDSGLEVLALDGSPGIYSARYAGEKTNDAMNNQKLLDAMKDKKERDAKFISVLSFFDFKNKKSIFTYGELYGEIIDNPRGNEGFGYDPIFQVKNNHLTLAEMGRNKRMDISHRTISTNKMIKHLS
jgi:XTP/dITP diphosphohydrolase|tara:strand:+ start:635 stop:1210 length:576 start_codon:yes stop_codon:yes gene_type:complete